MRSEEVQEELTDIIIFDARLYISEILGRSFVVNEQLVPIERLGYRNVLL
jgi:hypothetical protein